MTPAFRRVVLDPSPVAAGLLLALALAGLSAIALAHWRPAALREEVALERAGRLGERLRALRARTAMSQSYAERERDVQALEAKFRSVRDAPELVRDIEALAAKAGVDLLQVSSRRALKEAAGVETTMFEFALKGSYAGLKGFLAELGGLPEFVIVERAVFERVEGGVRVRAVLMRRAEGKA